MQVSACHVYLTYPFVLSWSCLEALSMARVVVGSRTGPVEEVITHGENGLLVDFFDPAAMAQQVVDVLADPAGGPAFFRADITLPPAEVARLPPGTLSPGQPVEVFFLTGERTPLAYLLAPLSRYFDRAFRESG
jgi:glycosyltransferase involved in cell wall biosynthesis